MTRITKQDAVRRFVQFAELAEDAGLGDRSQWQLQQGSPTAGRAWRLYRVVSPGGGVTGALNLGDRGYIGWSAREAYLTLNGLVCGLEAAAAVAAK